MSAPHEATTIGGWHVEALIGVSGPARRFAVARAGVRGFLEIAAEPTPTSKGRVSRGANLVAMIDHVGVPRLLDLGTDEAGLPYFVTDLVDGVSLDRLRGTLTVGEAIGVAKHTLEALAAVHDRGIVHASVRPSHLYVGRDHRVTLFDFGESVLTSGGSAPPDRPLDPAFDAPELASGGRGCAEPRTDLHGLAATLYFLLSARPVRTSFHESSAAPASIGTVAAGLPPELVTLIDRALLADPNQRWGSAREMAGATTWIARGRRDTKLGALLERALGCAPAIGPASAPPSASTPPAETSGGAEATAAPPWAAGFRAVMPFAQSGPALAKPPRSALPAEPPPTPPHEDTGTLTGPRRVAGPVLPFGRAKRASGFAEHDTAPLVETTVALSDELDAAVKSALHTTGRPLAEVLQAFGIDEIAWREHERVATERKRES